MIRVLVTGAGGNAALNFSKSLKMLDEKIHLVGMDTKPSHMECGPYDKRYLVGPCGTELYQKQLNTIVAENKIDFVHPQPDVEVAYMAQNQSKIQSRTYLPSFEVVSSCQNKLLSNSIMSKANVTVPLSVGIQSEADIQNQFQELKKISDVVWVRATKGAGSKAALPIKSWEQAVSWIKYWEEMRGLQATDFMLAEFLPGKEYAFQSLWWNGKLITSMARERIEYLFGNIMPSGQSSSPSIAKTVHNDQVNQIATKAILAISKTPHGIFCVDMKENSAGVPAVTEINAGRFFTTSDFFATAGFNMPAIYLKLGLGQEIAKVETYNPLQPNLFWVRGVDRQPQLFREDAWTAQSVI